MWAAGVRTVMGRGGPCWVRRWRSSMQVMTVVPAARGPREVRVADAYRSKRSNVCGWEMPP